MSKKNLSIPDETGQVALLQDQFSRPLHDLRISVMDRCNFRCPYCMPEDKYHKDFQFMSADQRLSFEEIVRITQVFAGLGVRKLRITGGEPLLRANLTDLIAELATIDGIDDIALTTNGTLLAQHAAALKSAGLNRVTVSLDSLDPEVFRQMSGGRGSHERVLEGIKEASLAGLAPVKINVVVKRGINDHTLIDMVEQFRGTDIIVRFIEYMDVGTINQWQRSETLPARELLAMLSAHYSLEPAEQNYRGEVASRYVFTDGTGEIGFINSVTEPFCGSCTRIRLSSDGKLFTCLFASSGLDLRGPLRDGVDEEGLLKIITDIWSKRTDRYSELRARDGAPADKVEMYYIGG